MSHRWSVLPLLALACQREAEEPASRFAQEFLTEAPTPLVVAAVSAEAIPSLAPGELVEMGKGGGSDLQVLGVAPRADGVFPSQVAVVFDRPMVELSAVEGMDAAVPVTCAPAIEGTARWAGTSTAVIVPREGRFPAATAWECAVPAATLALDGSALAAEQRWTFSTPRPALESSEPDRWSRTWNPEEPLTLVFNQPVDPEKVRAALRIADPKGKAAPARARASAEDPRGRTVIVDADLEKDTEYTVTLARHLTGREGPLEAGAEASFTFRTYPPLAVVGGPDAEGQDPSWGFSLRFSTEVPAGDLKPWVEIDPAPAEWKIEHSWTSSYATISARWAPRTAYTVTVKPGLTDAHGQALGEAATLTYRTNDYGPIVDLPEGTTIFPATNPPQVPVRDLNVAGMRVTATRLAPEEVAAGRSGGAGEARTAVALGPSEPWNQVRQTWLDLRPILVEGYGIVRVDGAVELPRGSDVRSVDTSGIVQVTDLGTTLKLGPDGIGAWVTRLSDGRPVPGAEVILYVGGQPRWSGRTGKGGELWAAGDLLPDGWEMWSYAETPVAALVRSGFDAAVTTVDWTRTIDPWASRVDFWFDARQERVQLVPFSDRGVYRPGERVHTQVFARTRSLRPLSAPPPRFLQWTLRSPTWQETATGQARLGEMGAASLDLDLPADAATGTWVLEWKDGANGATADLPISVQAYRPAAFRVEVSAEDELAPGGPIAATLHGRYLFGAPMAGAEVTWDAWREPFAIAPAAYPNWSFSPPAIDENDDGYEDFASGTEQVGRGTGALGPDGSIALTQELPKETRAPRPWTYTVEATVADVDHQRISNRKKIVGHSASAYAGVYVPQPWGVAGEPVEARFAQVEPDGHALAGQKLTVTVVRRSWDVIREKSVDGTWRWVSTPKDEPAGTAELVSAAPFATWRFTPEKGGYYRLQVEGADPMGRASRAAAHLWVSGADVTWARDEVNRLEILPDRPTYAPGDTARFLVRSPEAGLTALLTVEREGVWSQKVITLRTTSDVVEVPITAEMMPNAYVSLMAVAGAPPPDRPDSGRPSAWFGVTGIAVDPGSQRLDLALQADREAYEPRQAVNLRLDVTRGGAPVPGARVTLWAVDYGVSSLTAYEPPDLHAAFYQPRPLSVFTADARQAVFDLARFLAKGGPPGGSGGIEPRKNFVVTPLWAPDLRTGPDGSVEHAFTLPDNLTTFALFAIADDGATAFGRTTHEVRVTRPIIARPALPRFVRVGDEALAGVVIHNNTNEPTRVQVIALAKHAALEAEKTDVLVEPLGAEPVLLGLRDFDGEPVELTFLALAPTHVDAVSVKLPVIVPYEVEAVATAGSTEDEARESLVWPQDALDGMGGLDLRLSGTALVGVDAAVAWLRDYPFDCAEQETSRMRGALVARALGDRAGVTVPADTLDAMVTGALDRLDTLFTPSGGVSYWPGGRADPLASAWVLEGLAAARAQGKVVDEKRWQRLVAYLRAEADPKRLGGRDPGWAAAVQGRIALALARSGEADLGLADRVWKARGELDAVGQVELLETLARARAADPRVRTLLPEVEARVQVDAATARLASPTGDLAGALWYGQELGTATLVRALVQAEPEHPLLPRLVAGLAGDREGPSWSNTYVTATALEALGEYAAAREGGTPTVDATLGGDSLFRGPLTAPQRAVRGPEDAGGDLVVKAEGGRAYYEALLRYARPSLPARDAGITLVRTLSRVGAPGADPAVRAGDLVKVSLRVVSPVTRYRVALTDRIPAGLEPVQTAFATSSRAEAEAEEGQGEFGVGEGGDTSWPSGWAFDRKEGYDDRAVWFAERLPAGIHVVTWVGRATTPGRYAHPAAKVEEMYHPDVYGRTPAGTLVVGYKSEEDGVAEER